MALREMLTAVLTTYGSEGGIFEVVAQAEPPSMPTKSTRRMVAAATGGGLILIGFLLILLRELLRTTLRSAPEARLRLDLPVLGVLPWVRKEALALPWKPGATLMEACRLLAERVHAVAPDRGARILVTSACRGEGRELVSSHLAAAFGMRGDKVVLLDAEVRAPRDETGLEKLCPAIGEAPSGLGDLLAANSSDAAPLLVRTFLPGVHLLGRGRSIDGPEPLRSKTMTEILSKLSAAADLVIVRAAPRWPTVDAGLLAQSCDAVVFVVRAERTRASRLRRALDRLRSSGAQLRGTVLVGVKAPFDDID
jgi:Mrp family chromosome partitioning ATPase